MQLTSSHRDKHTMLAIFESPRFWFSMLLYGCDKSNDIYELGILCKGVTKDYNMSHDNRESLLSFLKIMKNDLFAIIIGFKFHENGWKGGFIVSSFPSL